jgi:hypothetical protein
LLSPTSQPQGASPRDDAPAPGNRELPYFVVIGIPQSDVATRRGLLAVFRKKPSQ